MGKVRLFDIGINNVSMDETVKSVSVFLKSPKFHLIITLNANHLYIIQRIEPALMEIYKNADLITADSVSLIWASRLLMSPIKERVTGADLLPLIFSLSVRERCKIFMIKVKGGGTDSEIERSLIKRFPGLNIAGTHYVDYDLDMDTDTSEDEVIMSNVLRVSPDILILSVGWPRGVKWIWRNRDLLSSVPVCIEVGAAVDFASGRIKRAPLWMRRAGLEWLFRLCLEPRRLWRRNLVNNTYFLLALAKECFKTLQIRKI